MTDAEKLAAFERVCQIVVDQMKLENHFVAEQRDSDAIDFTRLNAYVQIVNAVMGQGTMK
jgi:hypothetical protein